MRVCVIAEGQCQDVARALRSQRDGAETTLLARDAERPGTLPPGISFASLEAMIGAARAQGDPPLETAGLPPRAGEVLVALRALQRQRSLNELRFPARGALAWHAIRDARTGGELARARIILELQAGDGVLAEPQGALTFAQIQQRDAIRFCLENADEVRGDEAARLALSSRGWQLGAPRPAPTGGPRPRLAVVMAHRDSPWIAETLASLRAQTLPVDEVVIVDDASSTAGLARLREEAARDPRFRVHALEENLGQARARNLGVGLTDAQLLWFVDADNIMLPRMAERLTLALRSDPGAAWALPGVQMFHEKTGATLMIGTPHPHEFSVAPLVLANTGGDTCAIHRRDKFLAVGGFVAERRAPDDWLLWQRYAAAGERGVLVPEVLFKYRLRPSARWVDAAPSLSLRFAALGALHTPALLARGGEELAFTAALHLGQQIERAQESAQASMAEAQRRCAELQEALELERTRARTAQAEAQKLRGALDEMARSTAVQLSRTVQGASPPLHAAISGSLRAMRRLLGSSSALRRLKGRGPA